QKSLLPKHDDANLLPNAREASSKPALGHKAKENHDGNSNRENECSSGTATEEHPFVQAVHGVRYQVKDVARSVAFYTTHLGFTVEHQQLPAFASVSLGDATILLSGPQASGSRPMPSGQPQEPGGWNRVVLRVNDLQAFIE